ncbi:MAG: hypothetical protein BWZ07_02303 [Alphaproteobacteria bacterium ADurb.BinA280]|nr:MAG: hypothetical protein BWZ07_02303 [Alphaproteobacteria bacterium ADurb.BinA280]
MSGAGIYRKRGLPVAAGHRIAHLTRRACICIRRNHRAEHGPIGIILEHAERLIVDGRGFVDIAQRDRNRMRNAQRGHTRQADLCLQGEAGTRLEIKLRTVNDTDIAIAGHRKTAARRLRLQTESQQTRQTSGAVAQGTDHTAIRGVLRCRQRRYQARLQNHREAGFPHIHAEENLITGAHRKTCKHIYLRFIRGRITGGIGNDGRDIPITDFAIQQIVGRPGNAQH